MKSVFFIIFLYINLFSLNAFSQTIAVVNLQTLIDNNNNYINILKNIESNQEKYLKQFNLKENKLKDIYKEIEDAKLILNENEINIQINNYNSQLSEFTLLVEEFNFHYENQIIKIRESILKEIIKLIEIYVIENSIDLILDSSSYLIASNSLDITNYINDELDKLNLNLEFKDFEKN